MEAKKEVSKFVNKMGSQIVTDRGEEGSYTKAIEQRTERIPSGVFLAAGLGAIAGSLALKAIGRDKSANFVGQWVPTVLILGLYNKVVKLHGSERSDEPRRPESEQYN